MPSVTGSEDGYLHVPITHGEVRLLLGADDDPSTVENCDGFVELDGVVRSFTVLTLAEVGRLLGEWETPSEDISGAHLRVPDLIILRSGGVDSIVAAVVACVGELPVVDPSQDDAMPDDRGRSSAIFASWDELIERFGRRPGMWVGHPRYATVRSFVCGFGAARNDDVLMGFERWLSRQPQHRAIDNFAWWSLLLHEVFPDRDQRAVIPWDVNDLANADWPRPPDTPVNEDALSYPEDDALAISHLFRRLRQYLDEPN